MVGEGNTPQERAAVEAGRVHGTCLVEEEINNGAAADEVLDELQLQLMLGAFYDGYMTALTCKLHS
jgi:hypothetical protein